MHSSEKKNKKKIIIIACVVIAIILIIGIILISNRTGNSESFGNDYQTATIGQSISNDYADITFSKVVITKTAEDKATGVKMTEEKDKIYFIILGKITNKNNVAFNFSSNLATKLIFDDKYEYAVTKAPSSELSNIDPLETQNFVIYASVPKDVINICKNYSFKFGYNDDFSMTTIEKSKNKYELTGSVDQYGSASNVTNYETFKDYIAKMSSQYENLKAYDSKKTYGNNVIVSDGNALQYQKLDDGISEFYIMPAFRFSYSDILNEKKCRTDLIIEFKTSKFPDNVYYSYANTMEILSDNGSMKIEKDSTDRILDDTYKSIHLLETDFVFSSSKYDFAKLNDIINGNNLKIKVTLNEPVTTSNLHPNGEIEVNIDCSEKVTNALKQLFELDSKIEKEYK